MLHFYIFAEKQSTLVQKTNNIGGVLLRWSAMYSGRRCTFRGYKDLWSETCCRYITVLSEKSCILYFSDECIPIFLTKNELRMQSFVKENIFSLDHRWWKMLHPSYFWWMHFNIVGRKSTVTCDQNEKTEDSRPCKVKYVFVGPLCQVKCVVLCCIVLMKAFTNSSSKINQNPCKKQERRECES